MRIAALPRAFLRASLALWKRRRHYRHSKWLHYRRTKPEGHPLRAKWWRLYLAADQMVDRREHQLGAVADPAFGIDVSNHQPRVDFAAVKRAGYRFVYLKASEGIGFNDPLFLDYVKAANHAGLKVGAYHFVRPRLGRSGADEADAFIRQLNAAGAGCDLLPALDVEATRLDPIPTQTYVDEMRDALRRYLGRTPVFYTFPAFQTTWPADFRTMPLWIAHFDVPQPRIPLPWERYAMWQFTSDGHVPGVEGRCDVNKTPDLNLLTR